MYDTRCGKREVSDSNLFQKIAYRNNYKWCFWNTSLVNRHNWTMLLFARQQTAHCHPMIACRIVQRNSDIEKNLNFIDPFLATFWYIVAGQSTHKTSRTLLWSPTCKVLIPQIGRKYCASVKHSFARLYDCRTVIVINMCNRLYPGQNLLIVCLSCFKISWSCGRVTSCVLPRALGIGITPHGWKWLYGGACLPKDLKGGWMIHNSSLDTLITCMLRAKHTRTYLQIRCRQACISKFCWASKVFCICMRKLIDVSDINWQNTTVNSALLYGIAETYFKAREVHLGTAKLKKLCAGCIKLHDVIWHPTD